MPAPVMKSNPQVRSEKLLITKHALQMELPDRVSVYEVQECTDPGRYNRHWVIHGSANNKAFTIKLEPTLHNQFPYDEALQKLRVFA